MTYQIVGDDEADIKQGKISISSPIARALIGKDAGDVAEVQAPGGVKRATRSSTSRYVCEDASAERRVSFVLTLDAAPLGALDQAAGA